MVQKLRALCTDKGYSSDKQKKGFMERKQTIYISGIPQKYYTQALLAAERAVKQFKEAQ